VCVYVYVHIYIYIYIYIYMCVCVQQKNTGIIKIYPLEDKYEGRRYLGNDARKPG
jgi:hypothetical protein